MKSKSKAIQNATTTGSLYNRIIDSIRFFRIVPLTVLVNSVLSLVLSTHGGRNCGEQQ